jgi:hypothetical protein
VAYDIQTIIGQMNIETVTQAWFRFLHIIGRPVDFCDHQTIGKGLEMVRLNRLSGGSVGVSGGGGGGGGGIKEVIDPTTGGVNNQAAINFACVKKLPIIFLEVIICSEQKIL